MPNFGITNHRNSKQSDTNLHGCHLKKKNELMESRQLYSELVEQYICTFIYHWLKFTSRKLKWISAQLDGMKYHP